MLCNSYIIVAISLLITNQDRKHNRTKVQQQEIKIESTVWLRMIRLTVWPPYSINKGGEDGGGGPGIYLEYGMM